MRRTITCFTLSLLLGSLVTPVSAGIDGQPAVDDALRVRLSNAARWFLVPQRNVGRERADFLLMLEKSPAADITEIIAPALRDEAAYQGTIATFQDASDAAKDEKTKLYLRYNIARTHLLRARLFPVAAGRNAYAEAAAQALEPFDTNSRDAGLWELKGDVEAERGNATSAIAAYRKIALSGGSAALSEFRIGSVWQKGRRYAEAQAAYERALERDAASASGGGLLYHQIYQGIASLYLERGDYASAANAINKSARIRPEAASFPFRLDVAEKLLGRGVAPQLVAYLDAAVKRSPGDTLAADLLRQARARQ